MNKKPFKVLSTAIFFIFYSSFCIAQDNRTQINALLENPKIIEPAIVLEDFIKGKEWIRVIVNLSKPVTSQKNRNFKDMTFRNNLRETVEKVRSNVIGSLDPGNVRITNTYVYIFGFSAEVNSEGLKQLTEMDEVISINKDRLIKAHMAQGIPLINAAGVRNIYSGSGIAVAICDTGIDTSHPMLGGGGFPNSKVIGGYDTGDDDDDPRPDPVYGNAHGTCCAGIAAGDIGSAGDYIGGVAPGARLYALKISQGNDGSAWDGDMIEAWDWCVAHQYDDMNTPIMVISISFGGGYNSSYCDSEHPVLTEAAGNAVAAGISIFASSGNDGYCDGTGAPACVSNVISVGAVYDANIGQVNFANCSDLSTSPDLVTCYSNSAGFLDIFAAGNNAYTTDIVGAGGYATGDYIPYFGGTSAACPYAAGAAACLQSAAKAINGTFLTPFEVRSLLTGNGDPITDTKCGNSITKPRVNLAATVDAVGNEVPLDEALDNTSLPWTTAGDAGWFGQTTVSCHDGDAAKSGSISNEQSSSIETIVTGPGSLSFYWKVSSEKNYDFLIFSIDGISYSQMSGEVPCHKVTYEIAPGDHILMWSYTKDKSESGGSDAGWLDEVVFISGSANDCKGDFDSDGDVDSKDLSDFASRFGRIDCLIP
jgi:subtilisin family serine protease